MALISIREITSGPENEGKLRLMYEPAPMAMIAEQAGGKPRTRHRGFSMWSDGAPRAPADLYRNSAAEVDLAEEMQVQG